MPTSKPFRALSQVVQPLVVVIASVACGAFVQMERWEWAAGVCLLGVCVALAHPPRRSRADAPRDGLSPGEEGQIVAAEAALEPTGRRANCRAGSVPLPSASTGRAVGFLVKPRPRSAAAGSVHDVGSGLETLARDALRVAPGLTAVVALFGEDGLFRIVSATGLYSDRLLSLTEPSAPAAWLAALRTGSPALNTTPDDMVLSAMPAPASPDLRCALVARLTRGGEALGVVSVYHSRREAYTPRDAERLSRVAEIIAENMGEDTWGACAIRGTTLQTVPDGALAQRLAALLTGAPTPAPFALLLVRLDRLAPGCGPRAVSEDDPMLAEAAAVLQACLRPGDVVEFEAGRGFAMILENALPETTVRVCSRITTSVERMADHLGVEIAASAGYGLYPDDGGTPNDLLAAATRRLRMDRGARLA